MNWKREVDFSIIKSYNNKNFKFQIKGREERV